LLQILPSFVVKLVENVPRIKKAPKENDILALEGFRGLSCLMVIYMHWLYAINDSYQVDLVLYTRNISSVGHSLNYPG
jgi:hypothetical protein